MKDINIRIKIAENGCIVTVCDYGMDYESGNREKTYVYETLEEALKEVPSLVSVIKEEEKDKGSKTSEKDLMDMEAKVNRGED